MMHFHYMTCFATPEHKNHCPGSHETFDFGKPYLGHYYYTLSLFEALPWSRDDFKRNKSISNFLPPPPKKKSPLG